MTILSAHSECPKVPGLPGAENTTGGSSHELCHGVFIAPLVVGLLGGKKLQEPPRCAGKNM